MGGDGAAAAALGAAAAAAGAAGAAAAPESTNEAKAATSASLSTMMHSSCNCVSLEPHFRSPIPTPMVPSPGLYKQELFCTSQCHVSSTVSPAAVSQLPYPQLP